MASERPVLQTTFDLSCDEVEELKPGQALIVGQNGKLFLKSIIDPKPYSPCVFERIYFSRGNDQDIYRERKMLGRQLQDAILKAIDGDVENTVFSYIPNTAEVAYYGMVEGFRENFSHVRAEKVVSKDIKLRTFITEGKSRNDLAAHVYDITYGSVRPGVDNLVVIDDSIVRGTTLHESIIKILDRLHPKSIVIVSSAPQIRYPDFYGIDMSRIGDFIAFKAAVALRKDRGEAPMLKALYDSCAAALADGGWKNGENVLRQLYDGLSVDELNQKMVEILCPEGVTTPVKLVFQSIEGLHHAIPKHPGDWYFTGHYPTEGGLRMLYRSYMDWYESGKNNG